jgi:hypothetical protein
VSLPEASEDHPSDLLCPECMGPLAVRISMARCTLHGGTYRVLFRRVERLHALPARAMPGGAADRQCRMHPEVASTHTCDRCGCGVCETCAFGTAEGVTCPSCASSAGTLGLAPARRRVAAGTSCKVHPDVEAVERCNTCRTPLCATCDFALPGNLHLCGECATSTNNPVTGKRKRNVLVAYALAAFSSVGMIVSLAAAATLGEEAAGGLFALTTLFPSLIGTGLGIGALDRRLGNPLWIWGAAVWNGFIFGIFLLLSVIGTFMG